MGGLGSGSWGDEAPNSFIEPKGMGKRVPISESYEHAGVGETPNPKP